MSGSRAKANRRQSAAERKVALLTEAVAQAHDRLHKDQVDQCHELLHQAMGAGFVVSDVAPLTEGGAAEFDTRFRELCVELQVQASFVAGYPAEGSPGMMRLMSGGDAWLAAQVDQAMRARAREMGR